MLKLSALELFMPRYFFNVHNGSDMPDKDGTVLPDLRAAQKQAVMYAGELMQDVPDAFWDGTDWSMIVADERDMTLFTLTFFTSLAPAAMGMPRT